MHSVDETHRQDMIRIHLRNEFYKKKFYFIFAIFLLSLIIIGILLWLLSEVVKYSNRFYFITDEVGRFIQDIPLSVPGKSNEEVAKWAIEAVESAYTYNFLNYRTQLQEAQKYFTRYGWRQYLEGLDRSNNLVALKARKFIVLAKVAGPPKLLISGLLGESYAWKFQMPLLLTFLYPPYDDKSKFVNPIMITVLVQRQSILTSYKGLGVVQLIGSDVK